MQVTVTAPLFKSNGCSCAVWWARRAHSACRCCHLLCALQLVLHQKMPLPSTIAMVGLEKPLLESNSLLDGTAVQVGGR